MKKIIVVLTLALIVSCIFTVTPAKAEENFVVEAAAGVIEAALEIVPEKTQGLARLAFWIGNESGGSAAGGEMAMTFQRSLRYIDIPEEQKSFIKAVFHLGSATAIAELEEGRRSIILNTFDEVITPVEGIVVICGEEKDEEEDAEVAETTTRIHCSENDKDCREE